jgi:dolichol-phosphate mannosyltransferase
MPTYNEAANLRPILEAIHREVDNIDILVIDDDSPDGTGEIADEMAEEDDRIHVLHRTEKAGLGPAYLAGFGWALEHGYERVIEMDADFSHKPEYLPEMIAQLHNYDVVIGSRYVAGGGTEDWGWLRKFVSRGGGRYARVILGFDIQDPTAGFVGWRREVLEHLDLSSIDSSGYVFQIELKYRAYKQGYSMLEIPITFPDRIAGESKMTTDIALEALTQVWKLRWRI